MALPRYNGYSHVFHATQPCEEDECLVVGALQAHADGSTTFGVQSPYGAHVKLSYAGTGERVRRAALRKAAAVVRSYQVGDIVTSCREARTGEQGLQGSVGSRLMGFEKDRNSLGDTQPRTCWIICDSVPVCVAVDRLRPCTSAKLLAFRYRQTKGSSPLAADARTQQGFIDERAPLNPTFGHRLSI